MPSSPAPKESFHGLVPGQVVTVRFADGGVFGGELLEVQQGWLRLIDATGTARLANLAHVSLISCGDQVLGEMARPRALGHLPQPTPKDAPSGMPKASRVPGRPWQDDDLKSLSESFLDGADDQTCAQRFNRARSAIRELRQGFECARGNLVEDQISPIAMGWIGRWRKVLSGG